MNEEQKRYYIKLTEKIFTVPAGERRQYIANLKKTDMEFYERIEYLTRFLIIYEDEIESYAKDRIQEILSDMGSAS